MITRISLIQFLIKETKVITATNQDEGQYLDRQPVGEEASNLCYMPLVRAHSIGSESPFIAWKNVCDQGAIAFSFVTDWLRM